MQIQIDSVPAFPTYSDLLDYLLTNYAERLMQEFASNTVNDYFANRH